MASNISANVHILGLKERSFFIIRNEIMRENRAKNRELYCICKLRQWDSVQYTIGYRKITIQKA
jgi:hypothetical protein